MSAWLSIGALLLAKCARKARVHHIDALTDDAGLALALGLTALPKATHLGSYFYRVRRDSNQACCPASASSKRCADAGWPPAPRGSTALVEQPPATPPLPTPIDSTPSTKDLNSTT